MPVQRRGFWICEYCGLTLDQYEEANHHEQHECEVAAQTRLQHHFQAPTTEYPRFESNTTRIPDSTPMPPFDHPGPTLELDDRHRYPTYEYHEYPSSSSSQHRATSTPPAPATRAPSTSLYPGTCRFSPLPLVDQDESVQLHDVDTMACRSLEFFPVQNENSPTQQQQRNESNLVGVRCRYCVNEKTASSSWHTSYIIPRRSTQVGECVRRLAGHLVACRSVPSPIRRTLNQREQKRKLYEEDGGDSWHQEQSRLRALIDYCTRKCQHLGFTDNFPDNTGIVASAANVGNVSAFQAVAGTERDDVVDASSRNSNSPDQRVAALRTTEHYHSANQPTDVDVTSAPRPPLYMGFRPSPPHIPSPYFDQRQEQQQQQRDLVGATYNFNPVSNTNAGNCFTDLEPTPVAAIPPPTLSAQTALQGQAQAPPPQRYVQKPFIQRPPQRQPPPTPTVTTATYAIPPNFPYAQDQSGDWVCKYCSHLPPHLRDKQDRWPAYQKTPPPGDFIDYHLSVCREFFRASYYHQQQQQQQQQQQRQYGYHDTTIQVPEHSFSQPPSPFRSQGGHHAPGSYAKWESATAKGAAAAGPGSTFVQRPTSGQMDPYAQSPTTSGAETTENPNASQPASQVLHQERSPVGEDPESSRQRAIDYLIAHDKSMYEADGTLVKEEEKLVLAEDKLLLTDYFFYLMKQLRLVRFSEADRRTRGGKRENVKVGYGGLQCVHCADSSNSRKFFWSNVDRLANSFAEIPGHVLKCRRCPQPVKEALYLLKERHPDQMARLPRGSQKVFFRRMWRRVHPDDPQHASEATNDRSTASLASPDSSGPSSTSKSGPDRSKGKPDSLDTRDLTPPDDKFKSETSPGTDGSDETVVVLERSTSEAATTLASGMSRAGPPSPSSRVLLSIPEDKEWLSDTDCFIRRQIEVFCATKEDVEVARADRKYPVYEGQVGIRCIHCALSKEGASGQAVAFPFAISGIYESVREFQRLHLDSCKNLPSSVSSRLSAGLKGSASLSSVLRKYYILAARALGLADTRDGMRAGSEPVPMGSQAAFAFSEAHIPATVTASFNDDVAPRSAGGTSEPVQVDHPTTTSATKAPQQASFGIYRQPSDTQSDSSSRKRSSTEASMESAESSKRPKRSSDTAL